jgi:hypothetical protein
MDQLNSAEPGSAGPVDFQYNCDKTRVLVL